MSLTERIKELRKNHLSIVQTGYMNCCADFEGEEEFIKAIIEEIIKPLTKEVYDLGMNNGIEGINGVDRISINQWQEINLK